MKNITCESKAACKFSKKVPEGFKSCFDTAKSKISKNAAIPTKNYGFTKQKHIRGDKTLKIQKFGPNVNMYLRKTLQMHAEVSRLKKYGFMKRK